MEFPIIRQVQAKTIGSELTSYTPTNDVKIKSQYTDYWGDTVTLTEGGTRFTQSTGGNHDMYGDMGHEFLNGWYAVNKDGRRIYEGSEFNSVREEFAHLWIIYGKLRQKFNSNDFEIRRGRDGKLVVNDKEIPGVEFTPNSLNELTIDENVELIYSLIQTQINSGRIQAGVFGI